MPPAAPDVETVVRHLTTRRFLRLEAPLIAAVLQRLETQPTFEAIFVREAMRAGPEGSLEKRWALALAALSKAGRQYSIGDAAFRETLELLQRPELLAACQAAAVSRGVPVVVAAALAKDGSEASFDALMAELERARARSDGWALRYKLGRLHRYAKKGPAWDAFQGALDGVRKRADAKKAESGFARALGLHLPLLELSLWVEDPGPPRHYVWVVASDNRRALRVQASVEPRAELKDVTQLASWLVALVKAHRLELDWAHARVTCNLRGRHRAAMLEWLQGLRPSPVS